MYSLVSQQSKMELFARVFAIHEVLKLHQMPPVTVLAILFVINLLNIVIKIVLYLDHPLFSRCWENWNLHYNRHANKTFEK